MADTANDDTAGKQPVQASGGGAASKHGESGEVAANLHQGGESAGGAYPNPHTGKDDGKKSPSDFMGHGGQTEQAYHGSGQLGDQKVGDQPNAPSTEK
jgi:hypothetical protein